jgi:hypothetical protein
MTSLKRIAIASLLVALTLACERAAPLAPALARVPSARADHRARSPLPDDGGERPLGESSVVSLDCVCSDRELYPFCASPTCFDRRESDRACATVCVQLGARTGVSRGCGRTYP